MKLVKKAKQVKRLAKRNEEENWQFRAYFRAEIDEDELDALAIDLHDQVSAAIDCTQCGNCCTEILPILDQEDVERFAAGLGISVSELHHQYLIPADEPERYTFNNLPCPFLKDKQCTNYVHRPKDCAAYPHLHKPGFRARSINVIMNCETCPIVFNVYERLKQSVDWPYHHE